ncbi:MAG: tetratricopeptide repeat protein [Acidobacteria bacterium]|nr:tetratricopeptide repeat protein [Acidobacteriota bacterium]
MTPDDLALLEEQRDFYRRSLADLDREHAAGDIDDADLATLRGDYQRRLDEVELELGGGVADLPLAPRRSRRRSIGAVAVVLAVALAAGVAVEWTAGARRPGDSASGSIRQTSTGRLAQAAELAGQGKYLEALQAYDSVLKDDPRNLEGLEERGLLLLSLFMRSGGQRSLVTRGRASIDAAVRVDPTDPRARFYLGLAEKIDGDESGARQAFEAALRLGPSATLRAQIESYLQPAPTTTTTTVSP